MLNLSKLRLPYREDGFFGVLAFTVFLIPLIFFLYTYENFETAKFALFLILTGAALIAFLKKAENSKLALKYNPKVFWLIISLLFWAVLSTTHSLDKIYSIFGFYYRFTNGVLFYFCFSLFLLLLFNALNRGKLIFLLKVLVFSCLIVAVISFLQSLGISFYAGLDVAGFIRAPGLLGNPNFSSMFLAASLPFAIFLLKESQKFVSRVYYGTAIFLSLLANLVLSSRGALLALAVGLLAALILLFIYRFSGKIFLGLLALSLLGFILGAGFLQISRPQAVVSIIQGNDVNTSLRLFAWQISLRGLKAQPLLGSGPGTYQIFFERNRPQDLAGQLGVFDDAHNLFLQMAVTTGLPFVLSFLGLLAAAGFYGLKTLRKNKDLLTLAALSALIIWAVAVCFNPVPIPMFLLLALIIVVLLSGQVKEKNLDMDLLKKTAVYFFSIIFIIFGLALISSEYIFGFARRAYANGGYAPARAYSSLAIKINPTNPLYYIYRAGSEIYLDQSPEQIVAHIEQAKVLHPGQAISYVEASNLYNLFYQRTKNKAYLESAAVNMQKALDLDKYYAERYGELALYYYQLGQTEPAQKVLLYGLSLKDDDFASWILLAKIYQSQGERSQTLYALEKAFKLRPDILQLRYILDIAKKQPDIQKVPIQILVRKANLD